MKTYYRVHYRNSTTNKRKSFNQIYTYKTWAIKRAVELKNDDRITDVSIIQYIPQTKTKIEVNFL